MMQAYPQRLHWDGCSNTRHLGGYRTENGRLTSAGALVRSDNLARLTQSGRGDVIADDIHTVIDLRFSEEIQKEANPFAEPDEAIVYHHCPLMSTANASAMAPIRAATTTSEAYKATLEGFGTNVAAILTAIADSGPGRVVIHCSAGKDRTGLMTALAMRVVGVSKSDIASDYALTDTYLKEVYEQQLSDISDPQQRAELAADLRTDPEAILETLDDLEARHGSVAAYLQNYGMSSETLERLRTRLLD
jgi:protein-tyrosine phosphatase